MDTNKVILTGNLTRDVEVMTTTGGKTKASFTIASNRVYKQSNGEQKKDAMFTKIVAWGPLADTCARFLHKGSKALIVGRLSCRDYESEPGKKVRVFEVIADEVQFLSPKSQSQQPSGYAENSGNTSKEPF
jgi:single-strand DNA-binding protein